MDAAGVGMGMGIDDDVVVVVVPVGVAVEALPTAELAGSGCCFCCTAAAGAVWI
jgi:hypothetical protein